MEQGFLHGTMLGMTYEEIEESAAQNELVLLPAGVVEEHGPHLPLGTDIYVSMAQAQRLKEMLKGLGMGAVIAPPFYFGGIQAMTRQFAGTFTSDRATITASFLDVLRSLSRFGYRRCVVLNNHGDRLHRLALVDAIKAANAECSMKAYWMEFEDDAQYDGFSPADDFIAWIPPVAMEDFATLHGELTDPCDWHAGAYETAMMRELFPGEVREDKLDGLKPTNLQGQQIDWWRTGDPAHRDILPHGYCGDPAKSNLVEMHCDRFYLREAQGLKNFFDGLER